MSEPTTRPTEPETCPKCGHPCTLYGTSQAPLLDAREVWTCARCGTSWSQPVGNEPDEATGKALDLMAALQIALTKEVRDTARPTGSPAHAPQAPDAPREAGIPESTLADAAPRFPATVPLPEPPPFRTPAESLARLREYGNDVSSVDLWALDASQVVAIVEAAEDEVRRLRAEVVELQGESINARSLIRDLETENERLVAKVNALVRDVGRRIGENERLTRGYAEACDGLEAAEQHVRILRAQVAAAAPTPAPSIERLETEWQAAEARRIVTPAPSENAHDISADYDYSNERAARVGTALRQAITSSEDAEAVKALADAYANSTLQQRRTALHAAIDRLAARQAPPAAPFTPVTSNMSYPDTPQAVPGFTSPDPFGTADTLRAEVVRAQRSAAEAWDAAKGEVATLRADLSLIANGVIWRDRYARWVYGPNATAHMLLSEALDEAHAAARQAGNAND